MSASIIGIESQTSLSDKGGDGIVAGSAMTASEVLKDIVRHNIVQFQNAPGQA